jgi:nitrogen regulatory protein P-II 2
MKLITAYVQPERLNDVKQALYAAQVFRMSISNALGCGQQKGYHESYRGADVEVNLLKKVRVDIAVNEDFVQPTIDAIVDGARTGKIGDGKIFVTALERCVRIRTGEEGPTPSAEPHTASASAPQRKDETGRRVTRGATRLISR